MDEKRTEQQVEVRMPDAIASGVYANVVNITASKNEIVLDFILHLPNQAQAALSSRVIVSPDTAQQMSDLLEALMRQVKDDQQGDKK